VTPELRLCESGLYPDGYYCAWTPAEAVARQANRTAGLPVSACALHVHQCYLGRTYGLEAVPLGTLCQDDRLVNEWEADCWTYPRPSYQPTSTPIPCYHMADQHICASSATEQAARNARTAANLTLSACHDSFWRCVAGVTFPLQPAPPGTLCWEGTFIHEWDDRCAPGWVDSAVIDGSGVPVPPLPENRTCACGGPVCCESQCSKVAYSCSGGNITSGFYASEGTVCFQLQDPWGVSSGYLIHEYDARCANAYAASAQNTQGGGASALCPPGETSIRCADGSGTPASADTCTAQYFQCRDGQAFFLQTVADGTLCYNGSIVHSSADVCVSSAATTPSADGGASAAAAAEVQAQLVVRGMDPDMPGSSLFEAELVLRRALANLTAVRVSTVAIQSSGASAAVEAGGSVTGARRALSRDGARDRNAAGAMRGRRQPAALEVLTKQPQSRLLQTYSSLELRTSAAFVPRTQPLPGVAVAANISAAAGILGAGVAAVELSLRAATASEAQALAAVVSWALAADPATGISPFAAAVVADAAALTPVGSRVNVTIKAVSAAAVKTPPTTPAPAAVGATNAAGDGARLSAGALAGTIAGSVVGAAILATAIAVAVSRRRGASAKSRAQSLRLHEPLVAVGLRVTLRAGSTADSASGMPGRQSLRRLSAAGLSYYNSRTTHDRTASVGDAVGAGSQRMWKPDSTVAVASAVTVTSAVAAAEGIAPVTLSRRSDGLPDRITAITTGDTARTADEHSAAPTAGAASARDSSERRSRSRRHRSSKHNTARSPELPTPPRQAGTTVATGAPGEPTPGNPTAEPASADAAPTVAPAAPGINSHRLAASATHAARAESAETEPIRVVAEHASAPRATSGVVQDAPAATGRATSTPARSPAVATAGGVAAADGLLSPHTEATLAACAAGGAATPLPLPVTLRSPKPMTAALRAPAAPTAGRSDTRLHAVTAPRVPAAAPTASAWFASEPASGAALTAVSQLADAGAAARIHIAPEEDATGATCGYRPSVADHSAMQAHMAAEQCLTPAVPLPIDALGGRHRSRHRSARHHREKAAREPMLASPTGDIHGCKTQAAALAASATDGKLRHKHHSRRSRERKAVAAQLEGGALSQPSACADAIDRPTAGSAGLSGPRFAEACALTLDEPFAGRTSTPCARISRCEIASERHTVSAATSGLAVPEPNASRAGSGRSVG